MKNILFEALKDIPADYIEVRYEYSEATVIGIHNLDIENSGNSNFCGGIVRAYLKGAWGVALFDDISQLKQHALNAYHNALLAQRDDEKLEFYAEDIVDFEHNVEFKNDFRDVPLDEKLALVFHYNDILQKKTANKETTSVDYVEGMRTVHFANSLGCYFKEERPRIKCMYSATARKGDLIQRAGDGISSIDDYNKLLNLDEEVEKIADLTAKLLNAPKCQGGAQSVILDNKLGGVFIHEAFGHLSEADFLYDNDKMRELMHLGREVGVKELNVIDDGSMIGQAGSIIFDDEGTPSSKNYLIKDGVLSGHLHSRETAAKMGAKPTGNARAVNRSNAPIVRMTNTYIDAGSLEKRELFSGVENGVYACDAFGGQTMHEMFTFSAGYGYRIENGEIAELVRDVVLTGNVFDTLHNIDGIANDLQIISSPGGCGKGGQSMLPVGFGAPHIRIRNCVIGGE
ncbi:TldD/PmbA family protein [Lentisphaerota bacterium WC36G]|nr:TldD/PmbA family protein [Lentisphaerae bacterium WC36]